MTRQPLAPEAPRVVAYIGPLLGDGMGVDRFGPTSRRVLQDWNGRRIGTCALGHGWPVRSCYGTRLYQCYAYIDRVEYTGRTWGERMAVTLRETAASRRYRYLHPEIVPYDPAAHVSGPSHSGGLATVGTSAAYRTTHNTTQHKGTTP